MDSSKSETEPVQSQQSGEWNLVSAPSNDEVPKKDESPQQDGLGVEHSASPAEDSAADKPKPADRDLDAEKLAPTAEDLDADSVLVQPPAPTRTVPAETAENVESSAAPATKKSFLVAKGQTALNFIERTFAPKKGTEPAVTGQDGENRDASPLSAEHPEKKAAPFGEEWPEKALAFKNYVRDGGKNVVDGGKNVMSNVVDGGKNVVTNVVDGGKTVVGKVMRRLSGKKEDLDRPEDLDKSTIPEDDNEAEAEEEAQGSGREVKGRVTIFSVSGSPDCRAAKSLFSKRGIKFVEINLDVFPERRPELEEKSKSVEVPQVFFNDVVIGGLDQLIALEESGELEDKLAIVYENEANQGTPVPPVYGERAGSGALDEYIELVKTLRTKLSIKDRFLKYRVINKCFIGSEAVDIVMEDQHITRDMVSRRFAVLCRYLPGLRSAHSR